MRGADLPACRSRGEPCRRWYFRDMRLELEPRAAVCRPADPEPSATGSRSTRQAAELPLGPTDAGLPSRASVPYPRATASNAGTRPHFPPAPGCGRGLRRHRPRRRAPFWHAPFGTPLRCVCASRLPHRALPDHTLPDARSRRLRFDLREPCAETPDLGRVRDPAAVEQTTDEHPGGFELAHVPSRSTRSCRGPRPARAGRSRARSRRGRSAAPAAGSASRCFAINAACASHGQRRSGSWRNRR